MTPEQIRKVIRKRLADGTYGPRTQLPSERDLSAEFGVPKRVISDALRPLKDNGDLHTSVGRGTRVPDRQSLVPLPGIREIEQTLRARINDGTYAVRTWLPTTRHLAAEFGVAPTSIQTALKPLQEEKLLASRRPLGTYVVDSRRPGVPPPGNASPTVANVGQALRERLRDGTYPPGSQLPTNQELATEFNAWPTTISKALKPLTKEGLIVNGPRRAYVARPAPAPEARQGTLAATPTTSDRPGEVTISAKNLEEERT
ncbi:GntR family transcriptional regulator [Streptomyces phaeochromogenes]|uniref:GntR family transcriptional regulator n=1 Tax=Streptomyces phaeochromogenes TaxID=1923 RepID=UPI0038642C06|nr:GntR family transcriptional regulator [Streptomyces phaeochromogenes]